MIRHPAIGNRPVQRNIVKASTRNKWVKQTHGSSEFLFFQKDNNTNEIVCLCAYACMRMRIKLLEHRKFKLHLHFTSLSPLKRRATLIKIVSEMNVLISNHSFIYANVIKIGRIRKFEDNGHYHDEF